MRYLTVVLVLVLCGSAAAQDPNNWTQAVTKSGTWYEYSSWNSTWYNKGGFTSQVYAQRTGSSLYITHFSNPAGASTNFRWRWNDESIWRSVGTYTISPTASANSIVAEATYYSAPGVSTVLEWVYPLGGPSPFYVMVRVPANSSGVPVTWTLTQGGVTVGTFVQAPGAGAVIQPHEVPGPGPVSLVGTIEGLEWDGLTWVVAGGSVSEVETYGPVNPAQVAPTSAPSVGAEVSNPSTPLPSSSGPQSTSDGAVWRTPTGDGGASDASLREGIDKLWARLGEIVENTQNQGSGSVDTTGIENRLDDIKTALGSDQDETEEAEKRGDLAQGRTDAESAVQDFRDSILAAAVPIEVPDIPGMPGAGSGGAPIIATTIGQYGEFRVDLSRWDSEAAFVRGAIKWFMAVVVCIFALKQMRRAVA